MRNIWVIEGAEAEKFLRTLGAPAPVARMMGDVRIAAPHGDGIAVKTGGGIWSPPMGRREHPLAPMLMVGGRAMWQITPTVTPMENHPTHDLSKVHNESQGTTLPVYERDLIALRDLLNETYPS